MEDYTMNAKRILVSVVVSLVLLLGLAPMAYAAEGDVTGSFSAANVVPDVTVLEIYSDAGLTTVADSITPQVMYYVMVTAGDPNTIDDIDEIVLQVFYDSAGANITAPGAVNTQTSANFTWDKDGGGSEWTVSAGSPTTWAISSGNSTKPSDMTASSDDWVFAITAGKVATESPSTDDWDMYTKVSDDALNDTIYTRDKEMLWYGEISTGATAAFGSVTPGTGFLDDTNEVGSISVNYTSNGNYDQKVKSASSWTGSSANATFDASGNCTNVQEFSLKADIDDALAGAVQVLVATGVSIDATGNLTGETGNPVSTNTLWLKVAATFGVDTYSGTITYIIADR
jgi:hypothetical protein